MKIDKNNKNDPKFKSLNKKNKKRNIFKQFFFKYKKEKNVCENIRCVVCMNNIIEILFSPCNHLICCKKCSKKLNTCCLCKSIIINRVKIYAPFN